jgi:hypothetical protein
MGVGGITTLNLILEKTQQRLKSILEIYKDKKEIKKGDKYYMAHSIIILLTLREIEIIEEFLKENKQFKKESKKESKEDSKKEDEYINVSIPQYHFKFKKIYSFKFKNINIMDDKIKNFKKEIRSIHSELQKHLDDDLINDFGVSVIDDVSSPLGQNGILFKIIEMSFDSNLHELYINYINEFIKFKVERKNIYTEKVLNKLKMLKSITQILLVIKIYIKLNGVTKDNLSKEELKECSKYITNDAVILTHFNLLELKKTQDIFKSDDIIKDNELALEELINFNKKIIDIINKIEKNIK